MTPTGRCPASGCAGTLVRLTEAVGWTYCRECSTSYDHLGNAYDCQFRLANGRGAT